MGRIARQTGSLEEGGRLPSLEGACPREVSSSASHPFLSDGFPIRLFVAAGRGRIGNPSYNVRTHLTAPSSRSFPVSSVVPAPQSHLGSVTRLLVIAVATIGFLFDTYEQARDRAEVRLR